MPAFRLAAVTGCRRGELLGLRWRNVQLPDIGPPSVTFTQTIVVVDGHPVVKRDPKNATSIRRVPIDEDTAAALVAWRGVQAAERTAWGDGWQDHGYVFTKQDGSLVRPDWFTKRSTKLVETAGLPHATPHDLRHTAATMMLENGVPAKVVADVLGHSSTRVTLDTYSATVERLGRDAVMGIGAALHVDG